MYVYQMSSYYTNDQTQGRRSVGRLQYTFTVKLFVFFIIDGMFVSSMPLALESPVRFQELKYFEGIRTKNKFYGVLHLVSGKVVPLSLRTVR